MAGENIFELLPPRMPHLISLNGILKLMWSCYLWAGWNSNLIVLKLLSS